LAAKGGEGGKEENKGPHHPKKKEGKPAQTQLPKTAGVWESSGSKKRNAAGPTVLKGIRGATAERGAQKRKRKAVQCRRCGKGGGKIQSFP